LTIKTWRNASKIVALTGMLVLLAACGGSSSSTLIPATDDRNPSVARIWNEMLLDAIRSDFARPTIHARNLFHISSAMYDAWAIYSDEASTYLLGNTLTIDNIFSDVTESTCGLDSFKMPADVHTAREEAISYAAYRLIRYRFRLSPNVLRTEGETDALFAELGYDKKFVSTDYASGSPAALGNYIASCYIAYGLEDGSNERGFFKNAYYEPVNPDLRPQRPGNPTIVDLDRWQPLALRTFIDQSGNQINEKVEFLSPEWGQVEPFALTDANKRTETRDGFDYEIFYDPGLPPASTSDEYKWGFALVSIWSSHLDPFNPDSRGADLIDISPASLGSIHNEYMPDEVSPSYYPDPMVFADYGLFFNLFDGGDPSTDNDINPINGQPTGYTVNPATGQPYAEQLVKLGDYARVLAEFWADGPDSETPPGHWFVILNEEVSDDPAFEKRFEGMGEALGPLEWDVKAYFALAGTMHDAAIASWGIKGYYDYVRPVSAIRAMADRGQSSDATLIDSYDPLGIPLYPGYIELVAAGDPLAGAADANVGKIKLLAWKGPDEISDPAVDQAGVDWILAERWWPYQRPSFVTPPFAGFISGHSTYSRAAAELLTKLTGDPYFPGGMSGFEIKANEFLVFEEGPSQDMTLEWATYRDASDQCSLSRIWGGIHPPADDIPGRNIGRKIGLAGFDFAKGYFEGN
jgi:hypothetical protein